ncbi:MAG: sodium-dependent bicarbonate transport family permease [Clostridium sp.]|nr:sodium-dependent bicarbonate transport family permease [Clostridium sp.]
MESLLSLLGGIVRELQSPAMAFLIAGFFLAFFKSELKLPEAIYNFTIFMLLMRIGMAGGLEIKEAGIEGLAAMAIPALFCAVVGIAIVLLGSLTLAKLPGIRKDDAMGTAGLFGAVSGATLMAGMLALEQAGIPFEGWVPALYPFMDIPALITAIIVGNFYLRKNSKSGEKFSLKLVKSIARESIGGFAISAMIVGLFLGIFTSPERVFEGFYDPLFRGFLSILMLILGMDAAKHLKSLVSVGHWYALYGLLAPFVHGFIGFGFGYLAHLLTGLSPGGVIMLAIIAASNSDISGPPTIRGGLPSANPAAYIGASTSLGTPVALVFCIPFFITLGMAVFGL